jgi:myosin heavy subunit
MKAGLKDNELDSLGLGRDPAKYRYLAQSGCYTVDGFNDKHEFERVVNAMKVGIPWFRACSVLNVALPGARLHA